MFRSAVEGEVVEVTNANIDGLSAVCDEFGFGSLSQRLLVFKNGPAYQQKVRVDALEERSFGWRRMSRLFRARARRRRGRRGVWNLT
jgi:hypothetical protein